MAHVLPSVRHGVGLPDRAADPSADPGSADDHSRHAYVSSARWNDAGWGLLSVSIKLGWEGDEHGTRITKVFLVSPSGEPTYLAEGFGADWL
jgi:hypothetical protein